MSDGDRIAKVLSRAGIASRREAERMIEAGRVAVNGRVIDSPALNVRPADRITLDGTPVEAPDRPRLWLYHKPPGLVTSAADEKGRPTVFGALPEGMPRVMSVGRLDLNSEGLLLLTNDGGIKRRLELPETGWLRKYRVRVKGAPTDADLAPLRAGTEVDGVRYRAMDVHLDRQQGANAWLTIGLREGKNREIRRALADLGFQVNRLIRVSYGPFRLGDLAPGAVEEIKPRVMADQLGLPDLVEGHAVAAGKAGAGQPGKTGRASGSKAKTAAAGKGADAAGGRTDRGGGEKALTGGKAAGAASRRGGKPAGAAADPNAAGRSGKARVGPGGKPRPGAGKPKASSARPSDRPASPGRRGPNRPRPARD